MSDEKITKRIEPPPEWAIKLSEKVTQGFNNIEDRLDRVEANQDLTGGQVQDQGKRMTRLEERMDAIETRQSKQSMRVPSSSEQDVKQDAAIAEILIDMKAMKEGQSAFFATLNGLVTKMASAQNLSWVKGVVGAGLFVGAVIIGAYLALKGH